MFKVILIGKLNSDPEKNKIDQEKYSLSLSIINIERWTDKNGNQKEKSDSVSISIIDQKIINDIDNMKLKIGDLIYVEGTLSQYTNTDGLSRLVINILPLRGKFIKLADGKHIESDTFMFKTFLIGRLGADPERKDGEISDKTPLYLSLAHTERWKDKNTGELREKTDWVRVCILDSKIINYAENSLKKGDLLYVEGVIGQYIGNDGNSRITVSIPVSRGRISRLVSMNKIEKTNNNNNNYDKYLNENHIDSDDEMPF